MVRSQTDWPKQVALGIGVMISVFAAVVLTAWVAHSVPIIQFFPAQPPLTRQGALAELLLGAALAFVAEGRRRAAVLCATIVLILAVLVGFEYALDRDLGIDQLLGRDYIQSTSPPGRMSPVAAFCYFGAGLAILAMSTGRLARLRLAIAGTIASVLIAVGLVMFLAYLLGQDWVYGWGRFRRPSVQAAGIVALLATGIIVLVLEEGRVRKSMHRWLPLALALGLSAGAVGVWQALIFHEDSQLPLLSSVILAGGILSSFLVAIAVWLAQRATLRSRELQECKEILDLAHDAVFVRDLEDKVTFWNPGAEKMYGWSAEEAIGRGTHKLLQTKFPIPLQKIEDALATRGYWEGELEHTTKDGTTIVVDSRWSLQRDEHRRPAATLQINRDITLRKRAEEELKSTQQRLALALAAGQMGAWDLDLIADRAWRSLDHDRIFGYTELLPTWSAEIFFSHLFPEDLKFVQRAFAEAYESGRLQFECRITRADNILRWISAEGIVFYNEQHTPVRMLGVVKDITELKQIEAQIAASKEQIVASARLSALGVMAGGVAHEINNPLSIIHASAVDLLRRVREEGTVPLEIAARIGERILQTANRITKIIKSMRHLAREGSQDRARPTPVSKIIEEPLEFCKERFKDHAVNLILTGIDRNVSVSCREVQIEQVLLNLLQNAFDSVIQQPAQKWVRLDVAVCDDSIAFSVTDSGPAIPPELRTKIMEPFFTTKEVGKGLGLGLSLSRKIVEEHGSKLELTEEGGHPRFSFNLPTSRK